MNKEDFIEYLKTLTPAQPFCLQGNCPLDQFLMDHIEVSNHPKVNMECYHIGSIRKELPDWAKTFIKRVDNDAMVKRAMFPPTHMYGKIYPETCLEILDETST